MSKYYLFRRDSAPCAQMVDWLAGWLMRVMDAESEILF